MPPFLVPTRAVPNVQGVEALPLAGLTQCSWTGPASGGPRRMQHFSNVYRIEALARTRPLVIKVGKHREEKARDTTIWDRFGRAVKFHQSPHDLELDLGMDVRMVIGCSVNGARGPASGRHEIDTRASTSPSSSTSSSSS